MALPSWARWKHAELILCRELHEFCVGQLHFEQIFSPLRHGVTEFLRLFFSVSQWLRGSKECATCR